MTPAQRWMILGGAVVVVVILGVFIFLWTRPPAPAAIELEGVVARAGQESFTLSEVTVFSGPQPCSLERLTVQVESRALLPSSPLQPGDLVTVKGEYHANENIDTDTPDVVFAWVTVPHTGDSRSLSAHGDRWDEHGHLCGVGAAVGAGAFNARGAERWEPERLGWRHDALVLRRRQ
jgi:hypothetical protein